MKKIAIILSVLAMATITLLSCGGAETPSDITKKVFTSLENENYDYRNNKLANQGEKLADEDHEKLKKMFAMSKGQLDAKQGIKSITIKSETISEDGNSCAVEAEIEYNNGDKEPATSNFIKENNEWKISIGQ